MDEGTQVKDIAKKEDYPKFKRGIKLGLKENPNIGQIKKTDRVLSQLIAKNMEDESGAIRSYNELLQCGGLTKEDRIQIEEFISDEKHHLLVLQKMISNYDGNIPTSMD